jgi:hypothetical protein
MDVQFKVEGLREIEAKFAELGAKTVQRVIREGLMAGGRVFQKAVTIGAQQHIRPPLTSGTAIPPNALARDIELYYGKNDEGLAASIVAPGRYTRHVAMWVEYGHRMVKGGFSKVDRRTGRTRGPGVVLKESVPAHSFIRPAFEATRIEAINVAAQTMARRVTELAKKPAGSVGGSDSRAAAMIGGTSGGSMDSL